MAEPLTYQEMLRTLGALLDQTGSKTATLGVSPEGVRVSAPVWPWPQHWEAEAIRAQAAWQRSLRLHPRTRRAARAGHLSQRLRVIGAALDVDGAGPYLVTVEADHVQVEGRNGYRRTFAARSIGQRVRLAPHLRGHLPP